MATNDFHDSRYKAMVKVVADLQNQVKKLEKELKQTKSDYNALKIQYLNFLKESAERGIKDTEKFIKYKQKSTEEYNKLLHEKENKGWNDL